MLPTLRLFALPSLLLLLLGVGSAALAQPAGDTTGAACPAPRVPPLCVELDARASVDPAAGRLTFRWDLGDGTTATGPVVKHCYPARARYAVRLDVVDGQTGAVRAGEYATTVDFTNQAVVDFALSADTVRVGEPVRFDATAAQLPACGGAFVIWDFRDGLVGQGRQVAHAFRKPGRFAVRMSVRATGADPECPASHCVSRTVVVQP